METKNLKELRELRSQEKAIKARIETVKPLAIEEAKTIQPDGGKFNVKGVGDFVLDKDPVLPVETSSNSLAVDYRKQAREQAKLKAQAAALTITMKGLYDAFKKKFARKATEFTYTLKCLD